MHVNQPCNINIVGPERLEITLADGNSFILTFEQINNNGYLEPYHLRANAPQKESGK